MKNFMFKYVIALMVTCLVLSACGSAIPSITNETPTSTSFPTVTLTPVPGIGLTMTSEKDGMTMVFVPAGKFIMGNKAEVALAECQKNHSNCSLDWFKDEEPPHEVDLPAFWIDQTEITNAMYAKCVAEGTCKEPTNKSSSTHSSYYGNVEFDDYPVIYVDWNMAKTYCEWRGDRLPTEAEWEKAASWDASTNTKRIYPWGDSIDCSYANYYDSKANKYCVGDTNRVASYESGKSPYGLYDMAGNVYEWGSSRHQLYPYTTADGREDLTLSGPRVGRGGSWGYSGDNGRSANKGGFDINHISDNLGFRCTRSLP